MTVRTRHHLPQVITLAVIAVLLAATMTAVWLQLTTEERGVFQTVLAEHPALILSAAFLFPLAVVLSVHWVFRHYIEPLRILVDDVKVMDLVNPSHRLVTSGTGEIEQLSSAINRALDRIHALQANVDQSIRQSQERLEREKTILATLMDEFRDGIVVCNGDWQILLYNKRARELLVRHAANTGDTAVGGDYLGLGRSIFGCIDRNLIAHAVEVVGSKLRSAEGPSTAEFVTAGGAQQLVRVEIAPVLDHERRNQGYVLILVNISSQMEREQRNNSLVESLIERFRTSLASVRAAVEVITSYPEMDQSHRNRLTGVIRDESHSLSSYLDRQAAEHAEVLKSQWPMDEILCSDALAAVKRLSEQSLDVTVSVRAVPEQTWVRIDSYAMVQALVFIIGETKNAIGVLDFECRASQLEGHVQIDILWKGSTLPSATLRGWEEQRIRIDGQEIPVLLKEVLKRNDAELWSGSDEKNSLAYVRILLPTLGRDRPEESWRSNVTLKPRPEFYDFDLFESMQSNLADADRLVAELSCTAFDTETTGLRPSDGDEIISIGAVRIVNGRLLKEEIFDQLVNPRRSLSAESVRVHGIEETMLLGQPAIEVVLPRFEKFVGGSLLVAHNAAFDMRFLQLKEAATGIKFRGPVLDTLLLSAIVHPHHEDQTMEGIARRFGVTMVGRHTALGDAMVTGEVFLKLLPLLADKGIHTLQQAVESSRKTYLARLKY